MNENCSCYLWFPVCSSPTASPSFLPPHLLSLRVLPSFLFSLLSVAFIPFQSEVERGYLLSSDIIPEHHFLTNSGNRPHHHTVITVQFQYLKSNSRLFCLSTFPLTIILISLNSLHYLLNNLHTNLSHHIHPSFLFHPFIIFIIILHI